MRHKVLVVLHADGTVEAFADREHIDVKTVVMPHAPGGEILAEEYMELMLPRVYREIYFPLNRRAVDSVRTVLPSQIVQQQLDKQFLSILTELRNDIDCEHKRKGYSFGLSFDEE